jgi:hypothetical protein
MNTGSPVCSSTMTSQGAPFMPVPSRSVEDNKSNFGSRSLVSKKSQSIFLISIQRSYVTAMNSTVTLMSMIQ